MPVFRLAVLEVRLAVVPQPNLVDVAHVAGRGGALDGLDEVVVGRHALGEVVEDVVRVVFEACGVGLEEWVSVVTMGRVRGGEGRTLKKYSSRESSLFW